LNCTIVPDSPETAKKGEIASETKEEERLSMLFADEINHTSPQHSNLLAKIVDD